MKISSTLKNNMPTSTYHTLSHFWQAGSLPTLFLFLRNEVQFSRSVVSNSLWSHELLHARPPCPLPTPGVYQNPCPLSRWCHPTISSSVIPFSSCPQSFPASGSFQMSQLFTSGGQSIGVSASTSVLPTNIQGYFLPYYKSLSFWNQDLERIGIKINHSIILQSEVLKFMIFFYS